MNRNARPGIFQVVKRTPEEIEAGSSISATYGDCPLVLQAEKLGSKIIQMESYYRAIRKIEHPTSAGFQEGFVIQGNPTVMKLSNAFIQRQLHSDLMDAKFDFSRFPFKLQKWNPVDKEWDLLTIDCQLDALSFLLYLDKNPAAKFGDVRHTEQVLHFETAQMQERLAGTRYIQVTPSLLTLNPKEEENPRELLRIQVKSTITFQNIRFTAPAVMKPPSPTFNCPVCLSGMESIQQGEEIYMAGCSYGDGHSFHKKCIEKWFARSKTTCPVCRTVITDLLT
jgi:hypothetical protein